MKAIIRKNKISGEMNVPSSKSHIIRAVTIAAMANGTSVIKNPLNSQDSRAAESSRKIRSKMHHHRGPMDY